MLALLENMIASIKRKKKDSKYCRKKSSVLELISKEARWSTNYPSDRFVSFRHDILPLPCHLVQKVPYKLALTFHFFPFFIESSRRLLRSKHSHKHRAL